MPLTHSPHVHNTMDNEGDEGSAHFLLTPTGGAVPKQPSQGSGHGRLPDFGVISRPSGHVPSSQQGSQPDASHRGSQVEAIQQCSVPPFWTESPELWFLQVESIFQTNQVRSDERKYHLVVGALNAEALQDIADILRNPPVRDKYNFLKSKIMNRLAETTDRRLQRALNELELGDKKPSQLLRRMRSLVGDSASEDVLRIKWLDLLPVST